MCSSSHPAVQAALAEFYLTRRALVVRVYDTTKTLLWYFVHRNFPSGFGLLPKHYHIKNCLSSLWAQLVIIDHFEPLVGLGDS